jgi:hypothetical protein
MPSATVIKQQSSTGEFQKLADAIIAGAVLAEPGLSGQTFSHTAAPSPFDVMQCLRDTAIAADRGFVSPSLVETVEPENLRIAPSQAQYFVDLYLSDQAPARTTAASNASASAPASVSHRYVEEEPASTTPRLPGVFVRFGPYEIRPACGYELPFGRDYQPIPYNSVSRLAGYIGLDEHSLYIREVPDAPEYGLRPSRNGVWVRQPNEKAYRRLASGEAERISPETYIRVGGNGIDADSGLPVVVLS